MIFECNWRDEPGSVTNKWMMKQRVSDIVTVCGGKIIIAVVGDHFIEFLRHTDHVPVRVILSTPKITSFEGPSRESWSVFPLSQCYISATSRHLSRLGDS